MELYDQTEALTKLERLFMRGPLGEIQTRKPVIRAVEGVLDEDNLKIIVSNMKSELASYQHYLAQIVCHRLYVF